MKRYFYVDADVKKIEDLSDIPLISWTTIANTPCVLRASIYDGLPQCPSITFRFNYHELLPEIRLKILVLWALVTSLEPFGKRSVDLAPPNVEGERLMIIPEKMWGSYFGNHVTTCCELDFYYFLRDGCSPMKRCRLNKCTICNVGFFFRFSSLLFSDIEKKSPMILVLKRFKHVHHSQ